MTFARILMVTVAALVFAAGADVRADEPDAVRNTRVAAGLCIVLPAPDAKTLTDLSCGGRFVVQGLADPAKLDALRAAIPEQMAGLVSVVAHKPGPSLPYADNLVDLLVIDLDALGAAAPAEAELLRVIAPKHGAVWQRKAGTWSKSTKPLPATFGQWTHYYADATNNPISGDSAVKIPTSLQWIAESPLRQSSGNQLVEGGRYLGDFGPSGSFTGYMSVRGAFNGIEHWRRVSTQRGVAVQRFGPLVMTDGLVYTLRNPKEGPLVALGAATGKEVKVFDLPLAPLKPSKKYIHWGNILVFEDSLLLSRADKLFCIDRPTGKLRWTFDAAGKNVAFPSVDPTNKRVGILIAADDVSYMDAGRQTSFPVAEVASVNLADGKVAWRIPYPIPDRGSVAAFLWADKAFWFHHAKGLGPGGISIGCVNAADGKTRWMKPNIEVWAGQRGHPGVGIGSLMVYPQAAVLARSALLMFKPDDGTVLGDWALGNSRCDNSRGDAGGFANFGHYFRFDGTKITATRNEVARNPCGGANLPVYAMHYYQPQMCGCFTAVRGLVAVSSQPVAAPVPDASRLERGPAYDLKPTLAEAPGDWPALLHDSTRSAAGAPLKSATPKEVWRIRLEKADQPGPAAVDWRSCANFNGPISAPVSAGGLVIVAAPDAHRIHAVDAATGQKRWTFTADARIDTPPTVANGRLYAGGRDGYVYCLDLATGQLAWRFFAARNHKKIVAYGQVESPWRVHGALVVQNGVVLATAGYHPDIDGGVHIWGLDPVTGAVKWQRIVTSDRIPVTLDPKLNKVQDPAYFNPNKFRNSIPSSDGRIAMLPGLRLTLADGTVEGVELGGVGKPKKGNPVEPARDWELMVHDWLANEPYMRSKDNDFGGPGNPGYRQSIVISGGKPADVARAFSRRWAWDAKRLVNVHLNEASMLVLDRTEPVGYGVSESRKKIEIGKFVPKIGKALALIPLTSQTVKDSSPYGTTSHDPVALILAGDHAIVAWAANGGPLNVHFRPQTTVQIVDFATGKVATEFPVKPGVIEHGIATARGRLFMSLEDGSLIAME